MATYTVSTGHNAIEPVTLTSGQVDTVTFTDNVRQVEIISNGVAEVRVSLEGSDPTFPAAGTSSKSLRLPIGGMSVLEVNVNTDSDSIKLLSNAAGAIVSVQRVI